MAVRERSPFLQSLELSVRAGNALAEAYPYLDREMFLALDPRALNRLRNVGRKTRAEIERVQVELLLEPGASKPNRRAPIPYSKDQEFWSEKVAKVPQAVLEEIISAANCVLMDNPDLRVIVNPDASLTVAKTGADSAAALKEFRMKWTRE